MRTWFADRGRASRPSQRGGLGTSACARVACAFLITAIAVTPATGWAQGASVEEDAMRAFRLVEESQVHAAAALLEPLLESYPEHDMVLLAEANLAFHQGRYELALERFRRSAASANPTVSRTAQRRLPLAESTWEVVRHYRVHLSDDGLVEVRYEPGPDEILLPWIEETLRAAYHEIGYVLGHWPTPPIRVEVYPRAEVLAAVSPLSEEAIATSGTVALCKYNKLMLTSPRGTLYGYGWRTTLAHEYVHQVVSELTGERVPIWLHEAIAKFLESRWMGDRRPRLDPSTQHLLRQRVQEDTLVTFEQMHPSMALLPSQDDAATAYAQVFTIVEMMFERRGPAVLRDLLRRIAEDVEVVQAVEEVMGEPFTAFQRRWMQELRTRAWVTLDTDFREAITLGDARAAEGGPERWEEIAAPDAQEHLLLGSLLRARGHGAAALVSYRKAEALMGSTHPVLQTAIARTLLDMAQPEEALAALGEVAEAFPTFYRTFLLQAEALVRLGRHAEALVPLETSVGINPFDPAVHLLRVEAYEALGRAEDAQRARRAASMVRS